MASMLDDIITGEIYENERLVRIIEVLVDALEGALVDDVLQYHSIEWKKKALAALEAAKGEL